jgi:hypothetical protein
MSMAYERMFELKSKLKKNSNFLHLMKEILHRGHLLLL